MPKLGMEPIRRAQLTQATFDCIHKFGFSGTTIARISKQAGVSTGIISHYFGGKSGLLDATMRQLLRHLGSNLASGSSTSTDPKDRIVDIINSNFAEEQVTPEAVTVWLAFWGQALHDPMLKRLQNVNLRRLQSNLRFWLKQLFPKEQAYRVAEGLAALIDGLWLRGAFDEKGIQRRDARHICLDYLESQLALTQKSN
ncbi:MAG: transcriptional regulator BetI [Hellea sp.]